ncbi:hypothetical protein M8C21_028233 [Ambrosia artemisiifolia]|uniref:Uncharacterized protein n=1 Tax=Ambrosia artemisiifolia TaxID=4212 RepID=A0AAD5CVP7_AMBAR|nr:hypothetical protein M8C21_028233 [Ambrosia artemisiifolia]
MYPYNILPLDLDSSNQAIMRYLEIQALFLHSVTPRDFHGPTATRRKYMMTSWTGYKLYLKDNVSNQRGHLILLLSNVNIRMFPNPGQQPNDTNG